jgi:hypothetical protein
MSAPSISGISSTSSGLPPGFPFAAFSDTADFLRPAPERLPPRPPVLFDFVGIFLTAFFYYPFEYAFFARVRGRCFPLKECFMILTAPTRQKSSITTLLMNLLVAGAAKAHQV